MVAERGRQPTYGARVTEAYQFLLDQIPTDLRPLIPSTLKTAYAAVDLLVQNEPILQVPTAVDNHGRIISWAVDLGFERLVKTGQWSFDCRWRYFERPTGQYLEILPSHSVLTISQVADPKKQPRDVAFRANKRLGNQGFLAFAEFQDERAVCGLPHILLLHGHQVLNFAHLAIPSDQHSGGYVYRTSNLMRMPHAVPQPEPPTEDTDVEAVLTLKEEIEKWRRDHDER